jgi:hypothetical protein
MVTIPFCLITMGLVLAMALFSLLVATGVADRVLTWIIRKCSRTSLLVAAAVVMCAIVTIRIGPCGKKPQLALQKMVTPPTLAFIDCGCDK